MVIAGCGPSEQEPPTLTEVHENIFLKSCTFSSCHQGTSAAGMLDLKTDPYAALVEVPASGAPSRVRVVPGDPDASYLMEKLTSDTPADGDPMPPESPLSEERIATIRAWIEAGALDD